MSRRLFGGLLLVAVLVAPASAFADASSTFDTDLDGWTATHPGVAWVPAGGNPGGNIASVDSSVSSITWIIAPSKFLGVWSSYDMTGSIGFDHMLISFDLGDFDSFRPYRISISGPGGAYEWTGSTPTGTTPWSSFCVPIKETEWTWVSGTWAGLLANVTDLRFAIELVAGLDVCAMDNIQLVSQLCTGRGACCGPWGSSGCTLAYQTWCENQGGYYKGDGTECGGGACSTPSEPSSWGHIKALFK